MAIRCTSSGDRGRPPSRPLRGAKPTDLEPRGARDGAESEGARCRTFLVQIIPQRVGRTADSPKPPINPRTETGAQHLNLTGAAAAQIRRRRSPPAMARPALEVADILRDHGPAWRGANSGHMSLDQLKVMSAIEHCRTAALGGYVARCENATCAHTEIAYNSCRNRHCPKCQAAASRRWLADREAELLPVPYFHVVY